MNWRLLIVTVAVIGIGCPLAYGWYRRQVQQTAVALLKRAEAYEAEEKWSEAATSLERYILLRPEDSSARVQLVDVYEKSVETGREKWRFNRMLYHAIGLEPDRHDLRMKLADNLLQLGLFPAAEKEARKVLSTESGDASAARRVVALSLYARARQDGAVTLEEAAAALDEALADRPGDIQLASITASFLRQHPNSLPGKEVDVATYADQLIDAMVTANPDDPDALVARYRYLKRYLPTGAKPSDIETALDLNPDHVEALLLAATEALSANEGQDGSAAAEAHLRHVINVQPTDPRGHLSLAYLISRSGDRGRAARILRQGRQHVGDDNTDILASLVSVLIDDGKLDEVENYILEFEKTIRHRAPRLSSNARRALDNRLRMFRARLALSRKEWNPAITNLKAILASSERDRTALSSADYIQAVGFLGQAMGALGRWDMAADYWDRLTDRVPQNPGFLRQAAKAHVRAGQADKAIRRLERYIKAAASSEDAMVELVQAHLLRQLRKPRKERNWAEFRAVLEEAKQAAPGRWELILADADYLLAAGTPETGQQALRLLRSNEGSFAESTPYWRGLVLAYGQMGELEDAERALKHFETLEPSAVNKAILRTSLLSRTGRFDEADATLAKLLPRLEEKDRLPIELMRVRNAVAAGKIDDAKNQIAQLIASTPQNETLLKTGIEVALQAKDFDAAKQWEASLGELDLADGFEFRLLRARRLLEQHDSLTDQERDNLTQLVATIRSERPRWYVAVALAARYAELRGDAAQALSDYERAVELGDNRLAILQRLVALLSSEERYNEADEYLSRLALEQPDNTYLESLAISLAVKRNRVEEALDLATASVQRHPGDAMRRIWHGNLLFLKGDKEEAERVFREAVEMFPGDTRVWNGLFSLLVRTKQNNEARKMLETFTGQLSVPDTNRNFVAAQGYEMIGDVENARKYYAAAIQSAPKNVVIRLRYAKLLLSSDVTAARTQFEQVLKLEPGNDEARRRLATLLTSSGSEADWSRAVQLLSQQADSGESDTTDNRLRAVLLTRRGRTREERLEGLESARNILVQQLEHASAGKSDIDRLLLAGIYEQEAKLRKDLTRIEPAREQLRHLVDREQPPVSYLALYIEFLLRHAQSSLVLADDSSQTKNLREVLLNDARLRLEELKDAQVREGGAEETLASLRLHVTLLKAENRTEDAATLIGEFANKGTSEIEKEEERARMFLGVGNLYSAIGRDADAETWYRKLTSIAPGAYVLLVQSLAKQDKTDDAMDACLQAAQDQSSPQAATILAKLLTSSEQPSEAVEKARSLITAAADKHGDNVELLMAIAVMRVNEGESIEAIRLFRRVLQLSPQNTLALNNLATLLAEQPNQYAEAIECIDKAITIAGRVPALLDTRGTIFLLTGEPEKAAKCLEEATASGSTDPRYYFHLAAAYQKLNKTPEARKALATSNDQGLDQALLTTGDQELLSQLQQDLAPTQE